MSLKLFKEELWNHPDNKSIGESVCSLRLSPFSISTVEEQRLLPTNTAAQQSCRLPRQALDVGHTHCSLLGRSRGSRLERTGGPTDLSELRHLDGGGISHRWCAGRWAARHGQGGRPHVAHLSTGWEGHRERPSTPQQSSLFPEKQEYAQQGALV